MSGDDTDDPAATVAVRVDAPPARAFAAFTAEIDHWWRRGPKYRHFTADAATIAIEAGVGGRVFESCGDAVFELGRVTAWEPPHRFAFTWRNATFAAPEQTTVEVEFAAQRRGTLVTVRHRGWTQLRPDHPARHGMADVAIVRATGLWWGEQLSRLRERLLPPAPEP